MQDSERTLNQLAQLQPDAFCNKRFQSQPAISPVRAFFVPEALPRSRLRNAAMNAGLLFDRCRIVDFINGASDEVLDKVRTWTAAARESMPRARPQCLTRRKQGTRGSSRPPTTQTSSSRQL